MVKGLGDKTYGDRLQELNMYCLEERRERGDLIETFKYIKGANKVQEGCFFQEEIKNMGDMTSNYWRKV